MILQLTVGIWLVVICRRGGGMVLLRTLKVRGGSVGILVKDIRGSNELVGDVVNSLSLEALRFGRYGVMDV